MQLAAQFRNLERLGHVIDGPHARGFHGALNGSVLRENEHGRLRIGIANALEQFDAPQLRDSQVGQHDVHGNLVEYLQRLFCSGGHSRAQPGLGGDVPAKIANLILVVNDQHGDRRRAVEGLCRSCSARQVDSPF